MWNLTWQCSCCTSDLMGFHCLHLGLQKQQTYPTTAWFSWYVSKLCHIVFSLVSFVSLGYITNWTWMLSTLEMLYQSMDTFAPQGEWKCFTMSPWAKLCSFGEWEHVSHLTLCRWYCRWFLHFMLAFAVQVPNQKPWCWCMWVPRWRTSGRQYAHWVLPHGHEGHILVVKFLRYVKCWRNCLLSYELLLLLQGVSPVNLP